MVSRFCGRENSTQFRQSRRRKRHCPRRSQHRRKVLPLMLSGTGNMQVCKGVCRRELKSPFKKLNRLEKAFQEISRLETGTFLENSCRLISEAAHENSTLWLILTSSKSPRSFLEKSSKSYFCHRTGVRLCRAIKRERDRKQSDHDRGELLLA